MSEFDAEAEAKKVCSRCGGSGFVNDITCLHMEAADVINRAMKAGAAWSAERLQRASKWLPDGEPLSVEDFRAIKLRWATGPEQHQADADALISGLIAERERVRELEAELEDVRAERDELAAENGWRGE